MKINANDYLELFEHVYIDSSNKCTADVSSSFLNDIKYVRKRVEEEGLSFLTIMLPAFARDFERSLAEGRIGYKSFQNFRKLRSTPGVRFLPHLFKGMTSLIFDSETGDLHDERLLASNDAPSIIECIRQVCLLYKKIEIPCTPTREKRAFESFASVERDFDSFALSENEIQKFSDVSFVLWSRMLRRLRPDMLLPGHGPGATADRIFGNQKFNWRGWHERLEPYFPFLGTGLLLDAESSMEFEKVQYLDRDAEPPVRVVLVPKDQRSPRIIAIEPCCMQYTQQGIQRALYESIESSIFAGGHVNFSDQSVNQELSYDASRTGQLATIDLSDASDRVPLSLASSMFDSNPDIRDAILACRSYRAKLPSGEVISLRKFASMGSALCFPIEAMYFYTICVMAILDSTGSPVTPGNCFKASRSVYVYGDDIIVPTDKCSIVLDYLLKYNCKVNSNKTFYSGKFRESCGKDWYDGTDVTPVYVRAQFPEDRKSVSSLISTSDTANQFYLKGLWRAAQFLHRKVSSLVRFYPYKSPKQGILGRVSFLGYQTANRWSDKYHCPQVRALMPSAKKFEDPLDGYSALTASLLDLEKRKPNASPDLQDADRYQLSARFGAVTLKLRWVSLHHWERD